MKTYLIVKFSDKDKVKALGARFDMAAKRWFVPDGLDLIPFLRWIPNVPKLSKKIKKTIGIAALHKPYPPKEIVVGMMKWASKK